MPIIVNLDVVMAKRKLSSAELAEKIGLSQTNLSILKTGKARAIRFSTLEVICRELNCQPGDILEGGYPLSSSSLAPIIVTNNVSLGNWASNDCLLKQPSKNKAPTS
ncbi:MAG: hypothetical protein DDT19_02765 [Syntrophomonadaceae bacterium]|nr:hypothetical protein [Bacillota bacterium]